MIVGKHPHGHAPLPPVHLLKHRAPERRADAAPEMRRIQIDGVRLGVERYDGT
jgi:hypothetical protein